MRKRLPLLKAHWQPGVVRFSPGSAGPGIRMPPIARTIAQQLLDELLRRRKQEYVAPLYIGDLSSPRSATEGGRATGSRRAYEDRNGYLPPLLQHARLRRVARREPRSRRSRARRLRLPA